MNWNERRDQNRLRRYQTVLFYVLVGGIVLMGIFLFFEQRRMHERLAAANDRSPLTAPVVATPAEPVTLDLADDTTGAITAETKQLALPGEPSVRARALLDRLMAEYALPHSNHPLAPGSAVDDVFLLKLPIVNPAAGPDAAAPGESDGAAAGGDFSPASELAVVNLRGEFVDHHPSGVEVETLTIQSMLGTLHANFPAITEVRFLVDGQPHDTLAGHADLRRSYAATDTTVTARQTQPEGSDEEREP